MSKCQSKSKVKHLEMTMRPCPSEGFEPSYWLATLVTRVIKIGSGREHETMDVKYTLGNPRHRDIIRINNILMTVMDLLKNSKNCNHYNAHSLATICKYKPQMKYE